MFQPAQSQSSRFQPTHHLVSKARRIPVQLTPTAEGAALMTEEEWEKKIPAAFSIHPKRGFFCHDIQVLGLSLEPIAADASSQPSSQANPKSSNLPALNR